MDWRRTCYPCKHFLAVFKKFPNWTLYDLSPLYINSPFITLDDIALLPSSSQPNFKSFRLPMRKRKETTSGRVGAKVANVKRFRKVEVTDDSMNSQNLVSEIVIEEQPLNQHCFEVDQPVYIAVSYYILKMVSIEHITMPFDAMRKHFLKCLETSKFSDFPLEKKNGVMQAESHVRVNLYCTCKLPWLWYHKKSKDMHMA